MTTDVRADDLDDAGEGVVSPPGGISTVGEWGAVEVGTDTTSGRPVCLHYRDRDRGVALIGKSGKGKSSLLEHVVLADLAAGTPGMVIDPHGLLAERIVKLTPPEHAHRLLLLEVDRAHPFGLNLLDVDRSRQNYMSRASQDVLEVIKKLYGEDEEYSPRLEEYIDLAVRALIPSDGTLVDIPPVFRDKAFRLACLSKVTDEDVRLAFQGYDSMRRFDDQEKLIESVINRLSTLCRSDIFKQILGSKKTTVPFNDVLKLNGETMLIVSLPAEVLSDKHCDFLGSMLLTALMQRIRSRPARLGKPPRLHLYLDEYQRFATNTTKELLTQGRKFGAGVTLAHQDLFSIKDPVVRNASRHAGTMILLGVIDPDAQELAGEFWESPIKPRPERLETIEEVDGTEPGTILTLTPGADIRTRLHSDAGVVEAAGMLFPDPTDPRGEHDPFAKERCFTVAPNRFDDLLIRAMQGENLSLRAIGEYLSVRNFPLYTGQIVTNSSGHFVDYYKCTCRGAPRSPYGWDAYENFNVKDHDANGEPIDSQYPIAFTTGLLGPRAREALEINKKYYERRFEAKNALIAALADWHEHHLNNLEGLLTGEPNLLVLSDTSLLRHCVDNRWRELCMYHCMDVDALSGGITPEENAERTRKIIRGMREQFVYWCRWLSILCEGLSRKPIYRETADHQPRPRKSHILHGAQPSADARTAFAARLVNPPPFVAHIKQPHGYHETKLREDIKDDGDLWQLADVRARSQLLYCLQGEAEREESPSPPAGPRPVPPTPGAARRPVISREPGPAHPQRMPDATPGDEVKVELSQGAKPPESTPQAGRVVRVATGSEAAATAQSDALSTRNVSDPDFDGDGLFEDVADEVAMAALPTTRVYHCLGDYLPSKYQIDLPEAFFLDRLRSYEWWSDESLHLAVKCIRAAVAARGAGKPEQAELMATLFMRSYEYDRASRVCAGLLDAVSPVELQDIQDHDIRDARFQSMLSISPTCLYVDKFDSERHKPPLSAVENIATAISIDPPDRVAYMEYRNGLTYEESSARYFCRLCAQYGEWYVLLALWRA